MIHLNILPENQKTVFSLLANQVWINNFYLAGGTALALQTGHRQSIDFDFFFRNDFNTTDLTANLKSIGSYEIFSEDKNTLHGALNSVQVSFLGYKYPMLDEPHTHHGNIQIASFRDIACMKLSAIASRGSKKDFIDMLYILKKLSLIELFSDYAAKYSHHPLNEYQLLKSLIYFEDAERDAMPLMLDEIDWDEVKNKLIYIVREYNIH